MSLCLMRPNKMWSYIVLKYTVYEISAVVFRLFPKPVNLPQKTVGYQLTLIQSSNLYSH